MVESGASKRKRPIFFVTFLLNLEIYYILSQIAHFHIQSNSSKLYFSKNYLYICIIKCCTALYQNIHLHL